MKNKKTKVDENPFTIGSEFYYKNKKCKIIRDAGHSYFTVIQYENGEIDSVLKYDLRDEPSIPLKIRAIRFFESILYIITLGDYKPHFK